MVSRFIVFSLGLRISYAAVAEGREYVTA
jgi:hypothetical protein